MSKKRKKVETRGRPATGQTPRRSLRIPDEIWQSACDKAGREGVTVTEVVVNYLKRWANR